MKNGSQPCLKVYFSGCDFKCPYCNTLNIIDFKREFLVDLRIIKQEISNSINPGDYVIFTGGEPCLQRQALLYIGKHCRKLSAKIILETNGSKPECILSLIKEKLVDKIVFNIKSHFDEEFFEKTTKSATFFCPTKQIIENIKKSLKLLKQYENQIQVEFRTTIVPGLLFRKEDFFKIAEEIALINSTWILQGFKKGNYLVDHMFKEVKSPSENFIETLKKQILRRYHHLNIEIQEADIEDIEPNVCSEENNSDY